jgi:hypothetical protein
MLDGNKNERDREQKSNRMKKEKHTSLYRNMKKRNVREWGRGWIIKRVKKKKRKEKKSTTATTTEKQQTRRYDTLRYTRTPKQR